MKFLVVDGLRTTRLFYKEQIESITPNADIIQCMSAEDAIFNVIDKEPDIIISSDILSFRNCFEMVRILNKMEKKIPVIVIATDESNALHAIKMNVFAYLQMPVENDILKKTIEDALEFIDDQLVLKYGGRKSKPVGAKIRLSTVSGYKIIDSDDIAYFLSEGHYTKIYYNDGGSDTSSYFLGKIEEIMEDYHFMRISRSAIINLKNIHSVDRIKRICVLETSGKFVDLSISISNLKLFDEAGNLI